MKRVNCHVAGRSLTVRLLSVVLATWCLLSVSATAASGSHVDADLGPVVLEYAADVIQMDRPSGLLWVNEEAIAMTPEFLAELRRAEELIARDASPAGLDRAAATLTRESVAKLDRIHDALRQPENMISLRGLERCGPDGLRLGITMFAFSATCGAVSGGAAAGPCYLAIAAWTGATWKLGDCLGRNQPRGGRGRGNHGYTDSDGDGTVDVLDDCPLDPLKSDFGICGCGAPDEDSDGDGTPDCMETCEIGEDDCDDDDDGSECTPLEILSGDCL